jgi:hypothetical protein
LAVEETWQVLLVGKRGYIMFEMKPPLAMGSHRSEAQLILRLKEVLEELASCGRTSGFIWMVIRVRDLHFSFFLQ